MQITDVEINGALLCILCIQGLVYAFERHKLINKIMSRNYWEYENSKNPSHTTVNQSEPKDDPEEDFGHIV